MSFSGVPMNWDDESERFFAEFTLSGVRFFPFTSFRVRMTKGKGLLMTRSEGLRMANGCY